MGDLFGLIVIIYLILHLPAFILLSIGLTRLKTRPENGKKFLIAAGIYFLIGAGICGSILI